MKAVIDNDVLLKAALYGLADVLFAAIPEAADTVGVLGAARFVLEKTIQKISSDQNKESRLDRLEQCLSQTETVEPTKEEQGLAASFELLAQEMGVPLDTGESQLCSIVVIRALPLLATGDKRAVIAIQKLLELAPQISYMQRKVICLEQLIKMLITVHEIGAIRAAVCAEPGADKTLSICFSCASGSANHDSIAEGLDSYIGNLRAQAPEVLCD